MKCHNFRMVQSQLFFITDYTDNIMELVDYWFPYGTFIKVDTPF